MMEAKNFGKRVEAYIRRAYATQKTIARLVGVSPAAINRWIHSSSGVTAQNLETFCEKLKLTDEERKELFELAGLPLPPSPVLTVYEKQPDANIAIIQLINTRAHIEKAELIQYSSRYAREVIDALLKAEIPFKLLLCHPDERINALQGGKIRDNVKDFWVVEREAIEAGRFQIFLYRNLAAIRAVRLDGDIFIGYYTYEPNEQNEVQLHGHDNFVIHFPRTNEATRIVLHDYERTWRALLKLAEPVQEYALRNGWVK
jgi:transcriptional regulator with XRE-family HTH domain